jgi:hypothetical protein
MKKMDRKEKKREPILKEAFEYVKTHVYMPVSNEEFCIVEEIVAEKHGKLKPNEFLGDADLQNAVHRKLEKEGLIIPQNKLDAIVNTLYDFMFENGYLLPITLEFVFDKWTDWDYTLSDAIRDFKVVYESYPTIVRLSEHTKSQIDYVNSISPKAKIYGEHIVKFVYSDVIDNKVETCTVRFKIENDIPDKHFILQETPGDDDDDRDDSSKCIIPIGTDSKHIKLIG